MAEPKTLLGPMRLPFLVLPPACVLLGIGTALWTEGEISVLHAIIAFVGALAAHISVNALNEYYDFQSGLDARTVPTPFSGGGHGLREEPEAAYLALIGGLGTLTQQWRHPQAGGATDGDDPTAHPRWRGPAPSLSFPAWRGRLR